MRTHSWLTTSAALAFCLVGITGADRAEPIKYDAAGNMVWDSPTEPLADLKRPDFSHALFDKVQNAFEGVSKLADEHRLVAADVLGNLQDFAAAELEQLKDLAGPTQQALDEMRKTLHAESLGAHDKIKGKFSEWIKDGRVWVDSLDADRHAAEVKDYTQTEFEKLKNLAGLSQHELDDVRQTLQKEAKKAEKKVKGKVTEWFKEGRVFVDGLEYERHIHPHFPNYSLRLSTAPATPSCEKDVVQHSGYLDIGADKHLWFVFYESRNKPSKDPVMLWLNGGPGCSSSTGLLFELGPCSVVDEGESVTTNPYSWTNKANMIFLDQPVAVGYSYSEGDQVYNTPQAAEDVYAFLQLFFKKFPEYSKQEFTIAAESYGGTYAPRMAHRIWEGNQQLQRTRYQAGSAPVPINLATVAIGNGLTEPFTQFGAVKEYACDSEYAIFEPDSSTCQSLASKTGTCTNLIKSCEKYNTRFTCLPAALYCWSSLYSPAQDSGRNLYDVRRKCDRDPSKDGPLCYKQMEWIETYMNKPEIKKGFGVPDKVNFVSCNMDVNRGFMMQGDSMHNSALLLPELIEDGIRVLIYAGEADFMCNYLGNEKWISNLETSYLDEFQSAKNGTWVVPAPKGLGKKKSKKQIGGWVRKAGKGAGSVTFVKVKDAGHMVPYDQPEAASDLINRWLANEPLV